ncbi:tetratricopeptide repeat protein [Prochlorococcus sp. MIT 1306]|uniref:tetratricopeptide repeat protein n=1 Tax=Prochlorococcus sp. MIT 1306 TaxID=1799667 RepID=UPI0018D30B9C|nr:tetratricopeptide repeat protein [Prochlorococcus sp. MIT 1306]
MAGFGEQKEKKENQRLNKSESRGEALHKEAVNFHMQGDIKNAEILYRQAIKIGFLHEAIFSNLGVICKNSDRQEEAITLYEKAIEIRPDHPDAYSNLGNLHKELGNLDQALTSTLKSLELKPDNPDALINLGGIYKELGTLDQALTSTLKSLELKPDNPTALINLGGIYQDLGNLDQALASTLKSLELKPDNPTAHMNLGGIYQELNKLNQALASTLKSLELKPNNPDALMNLGSLYKDLGKPEQALTSTLKSLELKPNNHTAYINLGVIYQDLGNLDQALASTLKSLELKPGNPDAHINLGGIYKDLGNFDQALYFLREAEKNDEVKAKASILLAQTYYSIGLYREGVKALSETQSKAGKGLLLALYLCLEKKVEFNLCAKELIAKNWYTQTSIAAIDHANILYNQTLDNGLKGSTFDSIVNQRINKHEFSDTLLEGIIMHLSAKIIQPQHQGLLVNGSQTSGNILDIPKKPFIELKKLLIKKIDDYNQSCSINTDKDFKANWGKNMYILRGWAIVMGKGGNLKSHNHELGWLTGTFYLQMPEREANSKEGAIEFSHQGPKYPQGNSSFDTRVIRPEVRDLNIFSSSLFHRTLPFQSKTQRICIAFDLQKNEKLWVDFN